MTHFLSLTDSSFGFIGKIRIDEAGNKFLLTDAISNIAWDAASKAFFLEHALKGMEFKNPNSLFGHVIGSGELVISNDPKSDPSTHNQRRWKRPVKDVALSNQKREVGCVHWIQGSGTVGDRRSSSSLLPAQIPPGYLPANGR